MVKKRRLRGNGVMEQRVHTFRRCPVCGCEVGSVLFPVDLFVEDMGLPNHYDAVRCDYCGMCYANTTASEDDYEQYYSHFNYYGSHPGIAKREVILRHKTIAEMLKRYSGSAPEIVDVGFGRGELLQELKEQGFNRISGMDPSAESVKMLAQRGIDGFLGSVLGEIAVENRGKYDVAIMTEVMEHLLFPERAIQNLKALLKPGGYAVLSLPVFEDLSQYHLSLLHLIHHEHINYFSVDSLRLLMELNGFQEVEVKKEKREYGPGNDSVSYGVIGIYCRADEMHTGLDAYSRDRHTGETMRTYFMRQKIVLEEKFLFLKEIKRSQMPVAIFWGGGYLRQIWYGTELSSCNIAMIVDNSVQKQGSVICGQIIRSPQELRGFKGMLLITALGYESEILGLLPEIGFQGEVKVL